MVENVEKYQIDVLRTMHFVRFEEKMFSVKNGKICLFYSVKLGMFAIGENQQPQDGAAN
jgi:hypothetical protein